MHCNVLFAFREGSERNLAGDLRVAARDIEIQFDRPQHKAKGAVSKIYLHHSVVSANIGQNS